MAPDIRAQRPCLLVCVLHVFERARVQFLFLHPHEHLCTCSCFCVRACVCTCCVGETAALLKEAVCLFVLVQDRPTGTGGVCRRLRIADPDGHGANERGSILPVFRACTRGGKETRRRQRYGVGGCRVRWSSWWVSVGERDLGGIKQGQMSSSPAAVQPAAEQRYAVLVLLRRLSFVVGSERDWEAKVQDVRGRGRRKEVAESSCCARKSETLPRNTRLLVVFFCQIMEIGCLHACAHEGCAAAEADDMLWARCLACGCRGV